MIESGTRPSAMGVGGVQIAFNLLPVKRLNRYHAGQCQGLWETFILACAAGHSDRNRTILLAKGLDCLNTVVAELRPDLVKAIEEQCQLLFLQPRPHVSCGYPMAFADLPHDPLLYGLLA